MQNVLIKLIRTQATANCPQTVLKNYATLVFPGMIFRRTQSCNHAGNFMSEFVAKLLIPILHKGYIVDPLRTRNSVCSVMGPGASYICRRPKVPSNCGWVCREVLYPRKPPFLNKGLNCGEAVSGNKATVTGCYCVICIKSI